MAKIVCIVICVALGTAIVRGEQTPSQAAPAQPQPETKPAPPTPIAVQKAELGEDDPWNPEWDQLIEQSLPPDLLSPAREGEVKALCPRFKYLTDADKRAFWAYFFQALSGAEAGLKPTATVRHKDPEVAVIDPVTKHIARQEGLLQLAYMDSERYGCDFDWEKDKDLPAHDPAKTILQPENNLLCGIKILDNQLIAQHKPVLSKSSYWVTLRPGTYSFQLFFKQMANEPEACGAPYIRHRWPFHRGLHAVSEAATQPASQRGSTGAAAAVVGSTATAH
ncbi:MAG TPA: hypothetical protein VL991_03170 [Terracidiphilus sp.]|nr:hypothetical protein [Terracidiphilus sp.]